MLNKNKKIKEQENKVKSIVHNSDILLLFYFSLGFIFIIIILNLDKGVWHDRSVTPVTGWSHMSQS